MVNKIFAGYKNPEFLYIEIDDEKLFSNIANDLLDYFVGKNPEFHYKH